MTHFVISECLMPFWDNCFNVGWDVGRRRKQFLFCLKLICIANIRYHIKHRNILKCIKFEWKFKIFQVNVSPDFNVIHFCNFTNWYKDLKYFQNSLFQRFSPLQHKNITILYGFQGWRILLDFKFLYWGFRGNLLRFSKRLTSVSRLA